MRTGMEWDEWYLEICQTVAKKSQCLSRKIGAILVRDRTIISQGYNGPPRGVITCDERWFVDEKMRDVAGISEHKLDQKYAQDLEGICPRYVPEFGFKSGQGLEWCVAGHAERNTLINAARFGISTKGTIMYMSCGVPCTPCLVEIINAGVSEIVVTKMTFYDISAEYLLKQSGIKCRVFDHLKDEISKDY